jgi:predicted nucleotidyltransferase
MRLSPEHQATIRETLKRHFGPTSLIRLFGSRADDRAKGGDIDIYIEPDLESAQEIVEARLDALAELHRALGDRKIDLVIHRKQGPDLPIHRHARATGVPL